MTARKLARTIAGRRALYSELSGHFERWSKMTDQQLLKEVQSIMPVVTKGTRDQFLKFLTMSHVEKMIGE